MAIKLKSIDAIAQKFVTRGQAAAPDYSAGVSDPRRDWATQTAAAKESYNQGVQASIARDGFTKGVNAAGTSKWQRKAKDVGAGRYPQGIGAAKPDFAAGFKTAYDVIANTDLPPRFAKGDARNRDRVAVIDDRLRAAKIGA